MADLSRIKKPLGGGGACIPVDRSLTLSDMSKYDGAGTLVLGLYATAIHHIGQPAVVFWQDAGIYRCHRDIRVTKLILYMSQAA